MFYLNALNTHLLQITWQNILTGENVNRSDFEVSYYEESYLRDFPTTLAWAKDIRS